MASSQLCIRELARPNEVHYAYCMGDTILAKNIAALRKHLGDNQSQFASRLEVPQSYVSKWERSGVEPKPRSISKMASLANCTMDEFMEKPWSPPSGEVKPDGQPTRSVDAGETAEVIRLDLSLPMGEGATVDDYVEEEPFVFDLGYIRSFTRTPPARLRLASGVGDSMFPTLWSSDAVWIDSTQRILNQSDKIWAVSINGAAAIKRLRPLKGGRVLVMSDNKTIGDYDVGVDEIILGGRVIKFERDL
jgi:phage repressor protein C with HTH and peptisase S24 domain